MTWYLLTFAPAAIFLICAWASHRANKRSAERIDRLRREFDK